MSAPSAGNRGGSPFSPRTVLGLLLFGALAFIATLYFIASGATGRGDNNGGAHGAANGLTGYKALADLLDQRGHEVTFARSKAALDELGLLILTPPQFADGKELEKIVSNRRTIGPTLIITPKWAAAPVPKTVKGAKGGWVSLIGAETPEWEGFLDDVRVKIAPLKPDDSGAHWNGGWLSGKLPDPSQVLSGSGKRLVPLVLGGSEESILAAYVNDGGIYPALEELAAVEPDSYGDDESRYPLVVIFEPDLVNNYGMADRDRALLALAIIEAAIDEYETQITFDLTLNGLGQTPNLLTLAFKPPFLAATLCLIIAALVAAWRAFRRFGPPLAETPVFAFGKRQLAANGAALIHRSRRLHLLRAPYAALMRERIARLLGLRQSGDGEGTEAAIDRLLAARGIAAPHFAQQAGALRRARGAHELLRAAGALKTIERKLRK